MKIFKSSVLTLLLLFTSLFLVSCTNNDGKAVKAAQEKLEIGFKVEGDKLNAVTGDVILASKGADDVVITWESSKEAVISTSGKVVRGETDQTVTLTAELVKGKATETKKFDLVVLKKETSDNTLAEAAKVKLNAHYASTLGNPEWKAVEDVTLLDKIDELPIVWALVNGEENFSLTGKVTRPAYSKGDASIQIKATIDGKVSQNFFFVVEKLEETVNEKIQAQLDLITIVESSSSGYQEKSFTTLKKVTIDGDEVAVTWTSSDITGMDNDGTLQVFQGADKNVELTAEITYKGVTLSKSINFKLKETAPYENFAQILKPELIGQKVFVQNVSVYGDISGGYYLVSADGTTIYIHGIRDQQAVPTGKVFDVILNVGERFGAYDLTGLSAVNIKDGQTNNPVLTEYTFAQINDFKLPSANSMFSTMAFTMKNVKVFVDPSVTAKDYNTFIVPQTFDPSKDTVNKGNAILIYYQSKIDVLRALDGINIEEIKMVMHGYRSDKLVWYSNFFDFEGDIKVSLTPEQEVNAAEKAVKDSIKTDYYFNDQLNLFATYGKTKVTWTTSDKEVIGLDGKVVIPTTPKEVTLTATITSNEDSGITKVVEIKVNVGELQVQAIDDLLKGTNGTLYRIEGVITSFGPYNSFTMEDSSGAVAFRISGLTAASSELTFKVGDKVNAIVKRAVFNGLVQGELYNGKEGLDKVLVEEGGTLPVAVDLDLEELTAENLMKFQSKLVNLNNMLVTKHEIDSNQGVIMTLLRQDGQAIDFKWDGRYKLTNSLKDLKVNDVINIVGAPLSWYKTPVIQYDNINQVVKAEALTNDGKLVYDIGKFAPTTRYISAGDLKLPSKGLVFESDITYVFKNQDDTNNAFLNLETMKVTLPESGEATVVLNATFKLGEVSEIREVSILLRVPEVLAVYDITQNTVSGSEIKEGSKLVTFLNNFTENKTLLLSADNLSRIYQGNGSGGGVYEKSPKVLKTGTGSADGTMKLTFSQNVSKVKLTLAPWTATDTFSINGVKSEALGDALVMNTHTIVLDEESKVLDFLFTKRVLIEKIEIIG